MLRTIGEAVGVRHYCSVCDHVSDEFRPGPDGRAGAACPRCISLERHRFIAVLIDLLRPALGEIRSILDIAATPQTARLLATIESAAYTRLEYRPKQRHTDVLASLAALPIRSKSVDVIMCSHVLGYVRDDVDALREFARVMTPDGIALVQVPRSANHETVERETPLAGTHGGLSFVRYYGEDFESRLAIAGLASTQVTPMQMLGSAMCVWLRLNPTEPVWLVRHENSAGKRPAQPTTSVLARSLDERLIGSNQRREPDPVSSPTTAHPSLADPLEADRRPNRERMTRHQFVEHLHELVAPRTYLEIGVQNGKSLALASCRSIGVDPEFRITSPLTAEIQLVKATSDEFFARRDPLAFFEGLPVDFAFVDGMHLADFAYRDVAHAESLCAPSSIIVLDDVLPRSVVEAARNRTTRDWAGDVFKAVETIRRLRCDLFVFYVDTDPTGTAVVIKLDPTSSELLDSYVLVEPDLLAPDPQRVPESLLTRTIAVDPFALVASPIWQWLVSIREGTSEPADSWRHIRDAAASLTQTLGSSSDAVSQQGTNEP